MIHPLLLLLLLTLVVISVHSYGHLDKLCTDISNKDACNNIEREQTFECAENINSMTDCALNINNGKREFAILQPEQALLAANFVSDNVTVIAEITTEKPPYQTVVLARKFYNNSFEDLRNKRFCHPGFKHDELVTGYVLQEFEAKIIELNNSYCQSAAQTLLEKRLGALSGFFGPSCRPGEWAIDDPSLDASLKTKYSNLCEQCGPEKCNVNYQEPFQDALSCLRNGGDVAVTSLLHASKFFEDSNNIDGFVYVCPDGRAMNPRDGNCTFTDQLNRIVITERSIMEATRNYLDKNLPNHKSLNGFSTQSLASVPLLEESLQVLLELSKTDNITFVQPVPLKAYVFARRNIPNPSSSIYCEETVNWCTVDAKEQEKCLWLQQAALNAGLQPVIQCAQSQYNETISCINDIDQGKSDVAFVDVDYGYSASRSGLTYAAYPETANKDLSTIIIVVRNDSTNIGSLKGKKSCFPRYGGKEWLAFIDAMKSNKQMSMKSCDLNEAFEEFVGDSCLPGAKNKYFDVKNAEKLCAQCLTNSVFGPAKMCNNDHQNKYYSTDGALKCVEDKAGDFAVVTISDIEQFKDKTDGFRVVCRNGSLAKNEGLSVDSDCALTIITTGDVVVKNNTVKRSNVIQLLKGIDLEFGQSLRKTFKVFETFDNVPDLLFPDSTPGLDFDGDALGKPVENFKSLLENTEKCEVGPNVGHHLVPSTILMIILTIIVRF
ncbi:unnamed protein product [Phyllotreta striolata]|uniref:Transferrin-like domain-containing protein n=1 Tax=Phyllotreta striolata TaxID=444603 RepID=A0A9N9TTD1_PHYSR|nr:unnamed protein product [Phyllotreta striolata]